MSRKENNPAAERPEDPAKDVPETEAGQAGEIREETAPEESAAAGPSSTICPRYITAIRSLMWRTTARSCAMNR